MTFFKGSRYENANHFAPTSTNQLPFKGIRPREIPSPDPVLEHTVALKEQLDTLSYSYFAEPRLWHRIVETNTDVLFPEDLLWEADPILPDGAPKAPETENGSEKMGSVILVPKMRGN